MSQRKLHPDPQSEDRFHEILAASLRLFAKYGYEKTSIDRIAREIAATKGLVYYYFRSKDEILKAMVEAYDFTPAIASISQIDPSIPVAEATSFLVRGSLRLLDSRMEYVRFLYTEGQFLDEQSENLMRTILDVWINAVKVFLDKRIETGDLRKHDTLLAAHQFTDTILAFFLKTRVVNPAIRDQLPGRAYFTLWIDTFLHGLAPASVRRIDLSASNFNQLLRDSEGLTPEVLLALAPSLFHEERASGLIATLYLHLHGSQPGHFTIAVKQGKLALASQAPLRWDVQVELSADDFIALARGEFSAAELFLAQRLLIHGSVEVARRFAMLFEVYPPAA